MISKKFQIEYKKLNPKQREAVEAIEGPVMVIAGPGTGKTQILAMRIANILLKTQVNPSNILCLTFTNSGTFAMRKRLLEIIGKSSYSISVNTFHAYCNEAIQTFPEKFITARRLNQLTDLGQLQIIQNILDNNKYALLKPFKSPYYYQKAILDSIHKLKQENVTPRKLTDIVKSEKDAINKSPDLIHEKGQNKGEIKSKYKVLLNDLDRCEELTDIYSKYQNALQDNGKYDYADMILLVLNALKDDPDILSYYQERYQYILVDEYQDTNTAQNEIVKLLGSFYDNPNIFVVGDDEQSIFRFQGASLENILDFKKIYKKAKLIILENNYRSGQKILDASRMLITNNLNQISKALDIKKVLKNTVDSGGDIILNTFSNYENENFFIANEIKSLKKKGVDLSEIAVIYKEHKDAEGLIEILKYYKIPYHLDTGDNILLDSDISKLINLFKVINYQDNSDHILFEIMNYDFLKIPELEVFRLTHKARSNQELLTSISQSKNPSINKLFKMIVECNRFAQNNTFVKSFQHTINRTGYLNYILKKNDSIHHLNRLNILYEEIKKLNLRNQKLDIASFLIYLEDLNENNLIIKDREVEAEFNGVNLLTAHRAKGLEFEYVFIIKMIDGHWGNKTKRELIKLPKGILTQISDSSDIEEERRLIYVAMTRAKKQIYLTYAENYGDEDNSKQAIPSLFLSEIPESLIKNIKTKKEDNLEKLLTIKFSETSWSPNTNLKKYLIQIIKDYKVSATSLNSYLNCPQQFLLDHIIRVPKAKDFSQSYGTAVHSALENLFLIYIREGKLPSKQSFISFYKSALKEEVFTPKEYKRAEIDGTNILNKYYDFYAEQFIKYGPPIACEYSFTHHNVYFDKIPITGKFDKIELIDKLSNSVRVIDYKTSKPKSLNELLGKTKKKDLQYLYQAYFYKLLSENDPLFRWTISEFVFDFVQIEKQKFKRVVVPIDLKEYEKFKELLKNSYADILKLKFPRNSHSCKGDFDCDYINYCNHRK